MAFHPLTSVSSCVLLPPPASLLGFLPVRGFSSSLLRHSLNSPSTFRSRRTLSCRALLEDVEAWRSTVQHYDPLVLFPSVAVVPLLAANRRVGSTCSRVCHFMAQSWGLQRRGVGTLFTALILANAFYSDIAPPNNVDTFENVPQELNSSAGDKPRRIQRPKSKKAEGCTQKCLGTCIRGGAGSPGEGPFNIRRWWSSKKVSAADSTVKSVTSLEMVTTALDLNRLQEQSTA